MGASMRQLVSFPCEDAALCATLDDARGTTGLLIVSGGNEIRIGAHRGMAMLAAEIAAKGFPVFRFDRRGIGDSEGQNGGFASSKADIEAAIVAFKHACPALRKIVAFGNCDAASALLLHKIGDWSGLVLGNIWVIETEDEMPPPAAIKAHYLDRLKDPSALIGLFTGSVDFRKLVGGLFRLIKPQAPSSLANNVALGLEATHCPVTILLAQRDATALAFADAWSKPAFERARAQPMIQLVRLDSDSHSFAKQEDYARLMEALLSHLRA